MKGKNKGTARLSYKGSYGRGEKQRGADTPRPPLSPNKPTMH